MFFAADARIKGLLSYKLWFRSHSRTYVMPILFCLHYILQSFFPLRNTCHLFRYLPIFWCKVSLFPNLDQTKNEDLSCKYVDEITPDPVLPPPPPKWKRSASEWERDRIELAELDYGKHALRYKEVPPYFETTPGIK